MEHELRSNLIKIGEAAKIIGVTTTTLRRWEKQGFLPPTFRSNKRTGGTRFYSRQLIQRLTKGCF
jgi:DNA-binding transcriptional MerR regulator